MLSGSGETELRRLAHSLPRPLASNSQSIACSFEYGWLVQTEKDPDGEVEEYLSTWREGLASRRDSGRLQIVGKQIAEHPKAWSEDDQKLEQTDAGDDT